MTKKIPGAKRGRPPVDNPKGYMLNVRLEEELREPVAKYKARGKDLPAEVRAFVRRRLKMDGLLK